MCSPTSFSDHRTGASEKIRSRPNNDMGRRYLRSLHAIGTCEGTISLKESWSGLNVCNWESLAAVFGVQIAIV